MKTQSNPQANKTDLHHCHLENGVCIYCKLPQPSLQANKTKCFHVDHGRQPHPCMLPNNDEILDSLEHDFGFTVKEMDGIKTATHQLLEEARVEGAVKGGIETLETLVTISKMQGSVLNHQLKVMLEDLRAELQANLKERE